MITLNNLGQNRRGRIWIKDLPELEYKVIDKISTSIQLQQNNDIKPSQLALELLLSRRDMSNYAFLGVRFTPKNGNKVNICVHVGIDEDEPLDDHIAKKSDRVFVGIPWEYAEEIIISAKKVIQEISQFPSGDLEFYLGAHSEVGSSKMTFSKVTEIILGLLITEPDSSDVNKIERIVSSYL